MIIEIILYKVVKVVITIVCFLLGRDYILKKSVLNLFSYINI